MESSTNTADSSAKGIQTPQFSGEEGAAGGEEEIGSSDIVLDDPNNEEGNENTDEIQQPTQPDGGEEFAEDQVQLDEETGNTAEQLNVQQHGGESVVEPTTTTMDESVDEEEQQQLQQQQNLLKELEEGEAYDAQQTVDDAGGSGLMIDDADSSTNQQHAAAPGSAEYLTWNQILAHYFTLYPDPQTNRLYANGKPRIFVQCKMCGRKNDAKRGDPKTMVYHVKTFHPNLFVKLTEFRELIRTSTDPDELLFPEPFPEDMVAAGEDDDGNEVENSGAVAAGVGFSSPANNIGQQQQSAAGAVSRRQNDSLPSDARVPDERLAMLSAELGANFPDNVIADTSDLTIWRQLLFCFTRKLPPAKNINQLQDPTGRHRFVHECMFCNKRFAGVDDGNNAQPLDHFATQHPQMYRGLLGLRASYDAGGDTSAFSDHRLQQIIDDEKVRSGRRHNNFVLVQPNNSSNSTVTVAGSGKVLGEQRRQQARFEVVNPRHSSSGYAERVVLPPSSSGMDHASDRGAMETRRSGGQQVVLQAPRQQVTIGGGAGGNRSAPNSGYASSSKRTLSQSSNQQPYKRVRGPYSHEEIVRNNTMQQSAAAALPNTRRGERGAQQQTLMPQQQQRLQAAAPPIAAATDSSSKSARQVILVYYWLNMYDESNDSTLIMLPVMAGTQPPPSIEHLKEILRQEGQELGDSASRFKLDSDGITVVDRLLSLGFDIVSQSHTASEMVWTMVSV